MLDGTGTLHNGIMMDSWAYKDASGIVSFAQVIQ